MELRHLRYFVAAAEEQNFHRAAERLHVAQPALSRRVRDLEIELGLDLFERRLKRVYLSPAGRSYLEDVRQVLKEIDDAAIKSRRIAQGDAGVLNLGFPETVVRHAMVARSFRQFRASFPDVELNLNPLTPALSLEGVRQGGVDAAFVFNRPVGDAEIAHLSISTEKWMLAMPSSHPLAGQGRLRLIDLANEPFIWSRRELAPPLYDSLIAGCQTGGLSPNIIQYTVNESTKLHLVAAGMGISFVMSLAQYQSSDVVIREVDDLKSTVHLDLIWRAHDGSPPVRRFVELIAELKKTSS